MHGNRGKTAKWAASNLAHLLPMREGLPIRPEDSALGWREIKFPSYGSARLHVLRAKTDRPTQRPVLSLGPAAVEAPLAIRPHKRRSLARVPGPPCCPSVRFPVGSRRERRWQAWVMTSAPTELEPGCPTAQTRPSGAAGIHDRCKAEETPENRR